MLINSLLKARVKVVSPQRPILQHRICLSRVLLQYVSVLIAAWLRVLSSHYVSNAFLNYYLWRTSPGIETRIS